MTVETETGVPHDFAVGDHVAATGDIGLLRPRVPRGTVGVVVAFTPAAELEVQFSNGRVELVHRGRLRPVQPAEHDPATPEPVESLTDDSARPRNPA